MTVKVRSWERKALPLPAKRFNLSKTYAPINVMPAGGEAGHRVGI